MSHHLWICVTGCHCKYTSIGHGSRNVCILLLFVQEFTPPRHTTRTKTSILKCKGVKKANAKKKSKV